MSSSTPGKDLFLTLAEEHLDRPGTTLGRMFASQALSVAGRLYAFVGRDDRLVVKLPLDEVARLGAEGRAFPVVLGGRSMRAWVGVPLPGEPPGDWPELLVTARDHVEALATGTGEAG